MPLNLPCTNTQKIRVTANPDGPIDGDLIVNVASGDGTFEKIDALSFFVISGAAVGDTVYSVEGDADPSSDTAVIGDTITLSVTQAQASTLGLTADAPQPK